MSKILWICGRPGSGKTTLLRALKAIRPELETFDSEHIRNHLYPKLGFSDYDRRTNIRMLAELACCVAKHGGNAAVAAMTPTHALRDMAEERADAWGIKFFMLQMVGRSRELWPGSEYEAFDAPYWIKNDDNLSMDQFKHIAKGMADDFFPQPPRQLFIGRWHPFHRGHQKIIEEAIEVGPVAIGVRQTDIDKDNPESAIHRANVIREWSRAKDVEVFVMPDIGSIHIGRAVGYDIVQHDEVPGVSGSELRGQG